jgi:hypothetical protein
MVAYLLKIIQNRLPGEKEVSELFPFSNIIIANCGSGGPQAGRHKKP